MSGILLVLSAQASRKRGPALSTAFRSATLSSRRESLGPISPPLTHVRIHRNVHVGLHAMAFHENRNWFQNTLFTVPPDNKMTPQERAMRQGQIVKQACCHTLLHSSAHL